ncbi:MAG: flagellar motor stator protein MotA [Acidobacteriales bacterium]|nr:flagellar motor stator protein MotA [Terriglobales bacterium]
MFAIIGLVVVFGAVIGGYLLERGHLAVLMQPAELLIIGGAALGTLLVANPSHLITKVFKGLLGAFSSSRFTKQLYLDTLKMFYDLFNHARKNGLMSLENDVEEPEKSQIFSKYQNFLKDHSARDFVCDSLRMAITGAVTPLDLDQMMETDLDVHHEQEGQTVSALSTVADALPGLGIVAAVLGVVITMGALGGPPEQIGEKVAAALVGTFLGILMCYGLVGPLSSSMAKRNEEEGAYLAVLRTVLTSFIKGTTPLLALEIGRRAIPGHVRPSFKELEKTCKGGSAPPTS